MRKIILMLMVIGFLGVFTAQADAQERNNKRQQIQKTRIKRGVRSGSLTRNETVRLARERANLKRYRRKAKSDGVVTKSERRTIRRKTNKSSRDIYRAKHNKRTR